MQFDQHKVGNNKLAKYLERLSKHDLFRAKLLFSWGIVEKHPRLPHKLPHCPYGTIQNVNVYDFARRIVNIHSENTALILYLVLVQMGKYELIYDLMVDLNIPVGEEDKASVDAEEKHQA